MSTIESLQPSVENPPPASGQANGATAAVPPSADIEGFDRWIKDFQKYESILADISKATSDHKFKDELHTIETWFKVLTINEKTATIYTLLQEATQEQARFFSLVLQPKIQPEVPKPETTSLESLVKPKLAKLARPPSLTLPDPASPTTPTPATARESAVDEQSHNSLLAQATLNTTAQRKNVPDPLVNLGNTPLLPLFQKDKEDAELKAIPSAGPSANALPGFSGINPYTLNMLANAGLSSEAQLLAAQLIMNGLVQPTGILQSKPKKAAPGSAWRTPTSARYPGSALRSSTVRTPALSSLKSATLKSSLLPPTTPYSAMESPREEDFDPEMLKDIPAWLRSLRLHKYTHCFEGMTWQEIVALDDAALETKGVAALGARRRLLRTFEHVKKKMGMETTDSDYIEPGDTSVTPTVPSTLNAPALRSKLSINSPIFTPKTAIEPAAPADAPVTIAPVDTPAVPVPADTPINTAESVPAADVTNDKPAVDQAAEVSIEA